MKMEGTLRGKEARKFPRSVPSIFGVFEADPCNSDTKISCEENDKEGVLFSDFEAAWAPNAASSCFKLRF
jgi:hypothetical protein